MIRILLTSAYILTYSPILTGQLICSSDSSSILEIEGIHVLPLVGASVFDLGHYQVIVGGQLRDSLSKDDTDAIYSCDMIILDNKNKITYLIPLSYLPAGTATQFAGINYCTVVEQDTAYIMGGYGFDAALGYRVTYPIMTIFPIKKLIEQVVLHKNVSELFEVIYDPRLAVVEGTLLLSKGSFLVYDGKEINESKDAFSETITVKEWDFKDQMRKFDLKRVKGERVLDAYQICHSTDIFYQCMPDKKGPADKTVIKKMEKISVYHHKLCCNNTRYAYF